MGTKEVWREYVAHLKKHVPAAYANLAPGASKETIARLEATLGVELPESLKVVWRLNDGQRKTMLQGAPLTTPSLPTLSFLSTAHVAAVWTSWAKLRQRIGEKELAELGARAVTMIPHVVKPRFSSPLWIPLWADPIRANYIGLDFDPGPAGLVGQIINFGEEETRLCQYGVSFDDLIGSLLYEVKDWGGWEPDVWHTDGQDVPWFGKAEDSFFNTLHTRWEYRHLNLMFRDEVTVEQAQAAAWPYMPNKAAARREAKAKAEANARRAAARAKAKKAKARGMKPAAKKPATRKR